jgi:hypothetical protein
LERRGIFDIRMPSHGIRRQFFTSLPHLLEERSPEDNIEGETELEKRKNNRQTVSQGSRVPLYSSSDLKTLLLQINSHDIFAKTTSKRR